MLYEGNTSVGGRWQRARSWDIKVTVNNILIKTLSDTSLDFSFNYGEFGKNFEIGDIINI